MKFAHEYAMLETAIFQKPADKEALRVCLAKHPSSESTGVRSITAEVQIDQSHLRIGYIVKCNREILAIPDVTAAARKDELWRRTCFEAFLVAGEGYYEFNFSPSTEWAAYRFDDYRTGMKEADIDAPAIKTSSTSGVINLYTDILFGDEISALERPWRLGLTAVIQSADGGMSYWALAHPDGAPDFHDASCFALQIP